MTGFAEVSSSIGNRLAVDSWECAVPAAAGETPALPEPPDFDDAPLDFRVNLFSEDKRGLVSAKKLLAGGGRFCIVSPHWFVLLTFYGITS
jgi:hypothetical protein